MSSARGAAEPARFALLGLLLEGPKHGYDLARHFTPSSALGQVMHLSPSHLYSLLARLERDGLITGEMQEVGGYPPRRVHALTEAGREAVSAWIAAPVDHPRDMRIDFPLKFYLARRLDPAGARDLLRRQREVFDTYIARLETATQPAGEEADGAFITLVRAGRVGRARDALSWLGLCEALLTTDSRDPTSDVQKETA